MPPAASPSTALGIISCSRSALRSSKSLRCQQITPRHISSPAFRPFSSTFHRLDQKRPLASSKPLLEYPDSATQPKSEPRPEVPSYEITFTCTPCSTRSTHKISKQGYHHGSVLVKCPECKNRHIISDHLKVFGDKSMTIEDMMKEKGELFTKGTISEDGDVELWDDGATTPRNPADACEIVAKTLGKPT
ncbi:DNL zinc finger-domain-containing protein [Calycina marina]|uniref:DNL zinc finger-domain-containing protein n=1 Tax=Calycina marina TaxID=1763456 RepID=A0A9P7Z6Q5_9HELO|nr:DNL zinc finger-domain-containing protein [Calycina marina]